jgi:hypothetical protein
MTDDPSQVSKAPTHQERKALTQAPQRALPAAEARRQAAANEKPLPRERGGPRGLEPTRYGDWENKGIASDF